jgi:hypothetical protein
MVAYRSGPFADALSQIGARSAEAAREGGSFAVLGEMRESRKTQK